MAVFGSRTQRPVHWLSTALVEARRVGRIQSKETGLATGFLFDGGFIDQAYKSLPLFLTCNHCVRGPGEGYSAALRSSECAVTFQQMQTDPSSKGEAAFLQVLTESPVAELNYTLLLLDRWPGSVGDLKIAPARPQWETHDKVFVISYPLGGGLAVSLDDNEVTRAPEEGLPAAPDKAIFYRAPTQPGASGAPVFNEHWEIVAIHVGGSRSFRSSGTGANWGTAIEVVVDDARRRLQGFSVPQKIRDLIEEQKSAASPEVLRASPDYLSVFISYRHQDAAFARRLFHALESRGVRAWLDEERMVPGEFIDEAIQRGIQSSDRFVLCCSKASLENSWWVDSEIARIFEKERELSERAKRKLSVVIPVTLDGYLTDEWKGAKAPELRARKGADFRDWQNTQRFEESFEKLLVALRPSAAR